MRFSPKYVSPLVTFPLDRLIDQRVRGIKAQMLIQAMSCSHARCIFEQIKSLVPSNISVDWVGTGPSGRAQHENDRIMRQFCPKKNKVTGRRDWTLDILINVGICGEAADTIDVTEISFLTPANVTITNKQTIGRGARRMNVGTLAQPICNINVDTGSKLAKYIGAKVMEVFDEIVKCDEDAELPGPSEPEPPVDYEPLPEQLGWIIADMRLKEIRSEPMYQEIYKRTFQDVRAKVDLARSDEDVARVAADAAERALVEYLNRSNNESAIYEQKIDQIETALSKIAGLVIRRMIDQGMSIERSLAGDLRRRINTQKKRELGAVRDAGADPDLHWTWLKTLERRILQEHGLLGLPQWLR
jgi:hypothetical protein